MDSEKLIAADLGNKTGKPFLFTVAKSFFNVCLLAQVCLVGHN